MGSDERMSGPGLGSKRGKGERKAFIRLGTIGEYQLSSSTSHSSFFAGSSCKTYWISLFLFILFFSFSASLSLVFFFFKKKKPLTCVLSLPPPLILENQLESRVHGGDGGPGGAVICVDGAEHLSAILVPIEVRLCFYFFFKKKKSRASQNTIFSLLLTSQRRGCG